ncbi:MAG: hypothetical protein KJZ86_27205 [Caldilineaceae bacterium]|nr:hypothetical protein [Caldilineaceae bacterium]HRJ40306.1 hypothetical protein [Caldilineaceae bacterium]
MTNVDLMYWALIRQQELLAEAERERLVASETPRHSREKKLWPALGSEIAGLWSQWLSRMRLPARRGRTSNRSAVIQEL